MINSAYLTPPFDITIPEPMDKRMIKLTIAERDALNAYEGMEVYVVEEKKKYKYNGTTWEEAEIGGIEIYDDYSKFPSITKDVIVYAKENYEDVDNGRTYKSGFYFGELDTLKYIAISRGDSSVADWTSNIEVGGLASNTILDGLTSIEILKKITRKYVNASATVVYSEVNSVVEQGTSFNLSIDINSFTNGDFTPTTVNVYQDGSLIETHTVTDLTDSFTTTVSNIDADTTFEVKLTDSNNVTSSISKKEYKFVNATYTGSLNDIPTIDTEITALTKLIRLKANYTGSYTVSNQYIVFAYPSSFGNITSILDGNNFENITDFTKTNITINTVNYNVYTTNGKKTLNNFTYIFKY